MKYKIKNGIHTKIKNLKFGIKHGIINILNRPAIDMMMFFNNMLLALGFDEQKVFQFYYLKNLENARRYKDNY